jgi:dTDP-4-dehydrorhamnose 3,5-epimerase-like enzyme
MTMAKLYDFPDLGDDRGSLVVLDQRCGVPFDIKRAYYIFGTSEGISRGFHAHKFLHQIAVCVTGSCIMTIDDGVSREDIYLDSPSKAIDIPPMLWHEMHDFSPECVLLVLASDYYYEDDYIRNYEDFLEMSKK